MVKSLHKHSFGINKDTDTCTLQTKVKLPQTMETYRRGLGAGMRIKIIRGQRIFSYKNALRKKM